MEPTYWKVKVASRYPEMREWHLLELIVWEDQISIWGYRTEKTDPFEAIRKYVGWDGNTLVDAFPYEPETEITLSKGAK